MVRGEPVHERDLELPLRLLELLLAHQLRAQRARSPRGRAARPPRSSRRAAPTRRRRRAPRRRAPSTRPRRRAPSAPRARGAGRAGSSGRPSRIWLATSSASPSGWPEAGACQAPARIGLRTSMWTTWRRSPCCSGSRVGLRGIGSTGASPPNALRTSAERLLGVEIADDREPHVVRRVVGVEELAGDLDGRGLDVAAPADHRRAVGMRAERAARSAPRRRGPRGRPRCAGAAPRAPPGARSGASPR